MVCVIILLVTTVSRTQTAELIKMPVGIWARMESRNHVLGGGPDHSRRIGSFAGGMSAGRLQSVGNIQCVVDILNLISYMVAASDATVLLSVVQ